MTERQKRHDQHNCLGLVMAETFQEIEQDVPHLSTELGIGVRQMPCEL